MEPIVTMTSFQPHQPIGRQSQTAPQVATDVPFDGPSNDQKHNNRTDRKMPMAALLVADLFRREPQKKKGSEKPGILAGSSKRGSSYPPNQRRVVLPIHHPASDSCCGARRSPPKASLANKALASCEGCEGQSNTSQTLHGTAIYMSTLGWSMGRHIWHTWSVWA